MSIAQVKISNGTYRNNPVNGIFQLVQEWKSGAKGGFVRAADGVAKKGKTKAKQVAMKRGGKC